MKMAHQTDKTLLNTTATADNKLIAARWMEKLVVRLSPKHTPDRLLESTIVHPRLGTERDSTE